MTIILLATTLNYTGVRGIHRFAKTHKDFLSVELDMPYGIPCHNTFGRLIAALEAPKILKAFNDWALTHFPIQSNSKLATDGQALCSTVTNAHDAEQNFAAVVSLFCQATGITHALATYENKKASEIHVVAELLATALPKGMGILQQADALHSKKKRLQRLFRPIMTI